MKGLLKTLALLGVLVLSSNAFAGVWWQNGTPDSIVSQNIDRPSSNPLISADNFTVLPGQSVDILYLSLEVEDATTVTSITMEFFADAAGLPGASVISPTEFIGKQVAPPTDDGASDFPGFTRMTYALDIASLLYPFVAGDTYWFSVAADSTLSSPTNASVWWQGATTSLHAFGGSAAKELTSPTVFVSKTNEFLFALATIPSPGGGALMLIGLALLGARGRLRGAPRT